jgi:hypothetical protein
MKKLTVFMFLFILCAPFTHSQFLERFESLNETNLKGYATPFATTFGMAMNSGGFHSASIPTLFGFSFGIKGMWIIIPEDQKTFTPVLPGYQVAEVASIYGDKGGAFFGPNGPQITPPGINKSGLPMAYPQVTASLLGTEVLLRFLPAVEMSDDHDISMFGIGVRHTVSRYVPLFPVDVAVQVLYNTFEISNLMKSDNLAFNVHASKTFAIITPYIGLQYENSDLEIDYTYDPPDYTGLAAERLKVELEGDNNFRGIIGFSLGLGFLVFNADVNLSSQTLFSGGLTFAF